MTAALNRYLTDDRATALGNCTNGCGCAVCVARERKRLRYMEARIDEFIDWMERRHGGVMRRLAEGGG